MGFIEKDHAAAKSLQSCPTLCNPIDGSPPGSAVPGILQARTLGWLAISFSSAWKWQLKMTLLSRVRLFTTPWTAAPQAAPPMGFSRQEYWSGLPLPSLIEKDHRDIQLWTFTGLKDRETQHWRWFRAAGCALFFKRGTITFLSTDQMASVQSPGCWAAWQSSGGCRATVARLPP